MNPSAIKVAGIAQTAIDISPSHPVFSIRSGTA
jgi:hypothetical protein